VCSSDLFCVVAHVSDKPPNEPDCTASVHVPELADGISDGAMNTL
jgi:hypothetical protein